MTHSVQRHHGRSSAFLARTQCLVTSFAVCGSPVNRPKTRALSGALPRPAFRRSSSYTLRLARSSATAEAGSPIARCPYFCFWRFKAKTTLGMFQCALDLEAGTVKIDITPA